jgi:hypothetical protein
MISVYCCLYYIFFLYLYLFCVLFLVLQQTGKRFIAIEVQFAPNTLMIAATGFFPRLFPLC